VAFEQRDMSGQLFKSDNEKKDYDGKAMIGGTMYWVSAWVKRREGKKTYMSLAFDPMEKQQKPEPKPEPELEDSAPF